MRIAVLGAGSWGTTLAILLANNSHDVTLWSFLNDQAEEMLATHENKSFLPGIQLPEQLAITADLQESIHAAELIVNAIPAQYARSIAEQLKPVNLKDVVIVNVAKGIEISTLMTMSEMLIDVLPTVRKKHIVTVSGPSFAEEVARKIPTAVVAASSDIITAKLVQQTFMTSYFRVYSSEDIRGVELGGSIKNVIAIGAGIADGAGFGDNTKAAIMTRATAELSRLGVAMGAQPKTFAGLSGIGDLIVTCMSKKSRNRHVGEEIGKGRKLRDILKEMIMVAEGVDTTKSLHKLALQFHVELPIVNEVYEVLFADKDPIAATSDLMTRVAKGEN
ncbi:MAG: NAD(P)H-dependent glycerol-3-phosphate dehydrogenase [Bacteroidota bacterium]